MQMTNNDLQNITQKTKDGVTRTPVKTGSELRCLFKFDNTRLYRILYSYVFLLFIFLWWLKKYIFRLFAGHEMKVEWMEKVEVKRSDDKQEVCPSYLIDVMITNIGAREDDRKY